MACRKDNLIAKYGEELVDILMGGEIICPSCRCVHAKGIDYLFEEEKNENTSAKVHVH